MIITEQDIRQLVRGCLKRMLSEGISDITYHFTSIPSCVKMLYSNTIYLTMASNKSDAYDNKRLFYLSTQRGRNKELGYAGHLGTCVRVQLDGRMLSTVCKGRPVDYWGASMGKQSYYNKDFETSYGEEFSRRKRTHHNFEMEDRILSYIPEIKNASKYITRIDVYIDPQTDRLNNIKNNEEAVNDVNRKIRNQKIDAAVIYGLCNSRKIPFGCYLSLNDFNYMTDNTINDEIAELDKNSYKIQKDLNSYDKFHNSEQYRMSNEVRNKQIKANILCELFNILTNGTIGGRKLKPQHYKLVVDTLQKYGLQEYKDEILKRFANWGWGHRASESCTMLANDSTVPIRKLNHEIGGDDAIKIMQFGADVLRSFGATNFNDLGRKLN